MAERRGPSVLLPFVASPFAKEYGELLKSGRFSDLEIVLGARTWRVHKLIVVTGSQFFEASLRWSDEENKIKLIEGEYTEQEVDMVLEWMYTGMIDNPAICNDDTALYTCVRLYRMGDYFLIPSLRTAAVVQFMRFWYFDRRAGRIINGEDWRAAMRFIYSRYGGDDEHLLRETMVRAVVDDSDRGELSRYMVIEYKREEPRFERDWTIQMVAQGREHSVSGPLFQSPPPAPVRPGPTQPPTPPAAGFPPVPAAAPPAPPAVDFRLPVLPYYPPTNLMHPQPPNGLFPLPGAGPNLFHLFSQPMYQGQGQGQQDQDLNGFPGQVLNPFAGQDYQNSNHHAQVPNFFPAQGHQGQFNQQGQGLNFPSLAQQNHQGYSQQGQGP